jgi:hypothetical protein
LVIDLATSTGRPLSEYALTATGLTGDHTAVVSS